MIAKIENLSKTLQHGGGMAGQTRGAIGLSLNFSFLFCSSKKEKKQSWN